MAELKRITYSPVRSLFRSIGRTKPYNILCAPTNPRYIQMLSKTGHNLFVTAHKGHDVPFGDEDYVNGMTNTKLCVDDYAKIFNVDFDCVLSEHKNLMSHFLRLSEIQQIPVIHIEHHVSNLTKYAARSYRSLKCKHVFYNMDQAKSYGVNDGCIIPRGIDTNLFKPIEIQKKPGSVLVVANAIQQNTLKGFHVLSTLSRMMPEIPISIIGNNPGISRFIDSSQIMASVYNQHEIYLNTCVEPQPFAVLEAMACGLPIVSVPTMPHGVIDNTNALIGNTPELLISHIKKLQTNPTMREEMGGQGRSHVVKYYGVDTFTKQWDSLLESVIDGDF